MLKQDGCANISTNASDNSTTTPNNNDKIQPPPQLLPPPPPLPPPSPSSSTATQYSEASISASPYSSNSVGGAGGISNSSSHSATVFSALSSNLMRTQQKRDPMVYVYAKCTFIIECWLAILLFFILFCHNVMFYCIFFFLIYRIYEVLEILGKGSMGSVSRVRKREEAVGGSARPQFVLKHYTPRGKNALHNCWLSLVHHVGTCPFSPFIAINNNVFVNTENNSSHPSDLTVSNRKSNVNQNKTAASSMSSNNTSVEKTRPPSCGSRRRHKDRTIACIRLRACFGEPINDGKDDQCQHQHDKNIHHHIDATTPLTSDDILKNHNNTSSPSRHSNHVQPSSMIVRNSDHAKTKKTPSTFYALKSIHLSRCSSPEYQLELKNEVEILKTLDHPNIVRAIETFDYRHRLFIVLELCSGGDLYTREPYTEAAARCICKSLFSAVAYLHSKDIIHRGESYRRVQYVLLCKCVCFFWCLLYYLDSLLIF
jgi:serine/threonine protein kinase